MKYVLVQLLCIGLKTEFSALKIGGVSHEYWAVFSNTTAENVDKIGTHPAGSQIIIAFR